MTTTKTKVGYTLIAELAERSIAKERIRVAAPDMLEALERLTTLVSNMRELYQSNPAGKWLTDSEAYSASIAAIAKAKGGVE